MNDEAHPDQLEADECDCPCHHGELLDHCVPCCMCCPHCGRSIKTELYQEHSWRCQALGEPGRVAG